MFNEKYRPQKVSEVILNSDVKKLITKIKRNKTVPNMIFYGSAGTGKTSLAQALCNDMGLEVYRLNASIDNSIDTVRKQVNNFASTLSLTQKHKVVMFDEADNMSVQMQKALRGLIEQVHKNCRFIFTANHIDRIREPIQSRCTLVEIMPDEKLKKSVLTQCVAILKKEKIKYKESEVVSHIDHFFPDIRKCIQELETSSNKGIFKLDISRRGVSKMSSGDEFNIDIGKGKKLIMRPSRSRFYMMQVFKDGKKHRKSTKTEDRNLAERMCYEFYQELYGDEPSKEAILESIATLESSLSRLKTMVERINE